MTEPTPLEHVLTLKDVAGYLKVDDGTIYRLPHTKKMPAFKVGETWRFRKADIDAWIEAQLQHKGARALISGQRLRTEANWHDGQVFAGSLLLTEDLISSCLSIPVSRVGEGAGDA